MKQVNVVPARTFTKDFRLLPGQAQQRVLEAVEVIRQDPYAGRKVQAAKTGTWRWRVGDYRIRYDIEGEDIILLRVRHRREAYRG